MFSMQKYMLFISPAPLGSNGKGRYQEKF